MRTRSTMPLRLFSLPMGSCSGVTARPKALVSDSSTRLASARSRSMRLTTIMRGRSMSLQYPQTRWVTTSTPATPSTTTSAASTTGSTILASWTNMLKPGVSSRLILTFASVLPHSTKARPVANRHLAGDFFFVVVGGGGAVVHASEARRGAGGIEHGGHQGSFAGMPVSDEGKVAEIGSFVHFHGLSPSAGLREG